jgi:hypothetical protein
MAHIQRQGFMDAAKIIVSNEQARLSSLLLKPFVSRVKRRHAMRTVRFDRST